MSWAKQGRELFTKVAILEIIPTFPIIFQKLCPKRVMVPTKLLRDVSNDLKSYLCKKLNVRICPIETLLN
jgi:hypothetical protein